MNSTMINRRRKAFYTVLAVIFWLFIWEVIARVTNLRFLIPTLFDIGKSFSLLICTGEFYLAILGSLGRVLAGLMIGSIIGILLAFICVKVEIFNSVITPVMSLFKATPVASFIIILWFFFDKDIISILISLMMVAPILWDSVKEALEVKNKEMNEVAEIFELSKEKKFKFLTIPTLLKFTLPSLISASALAWKAGIAAEVITLAKQSIGGHISDAKNALDGSMMFAWTLTVVALSVIIEKCIKILLKRISLKWG